MKEMKKIGISTQLKNVLNRASNNLVEPNTTTQVGKFYRSTLAASIDWHPADFSTLGREGARIQDSILL